MNTFPVLSDADEALYGPFRQAALYDLGSDLFSGFVSAYFRTFAIPSDAKVLCERGESLRHPDKRATDTGIAIYEILTHGFDHARSEQMIGLLRRVHEGIRASNDDFLYILLSLLIVPHRWVQNHGVREWRPAETDAGLRFYAELGRRIGVRDIPRSLAAAEAFFDSYEHEKMRYSPEAGLLVNASLRVFRRQLPAPLRAITRPLFSALIEDPHVCAALGIPAPSRFFAAVMSMGTLLRRTTLRFVGPSTTPYFVPGAPRDVYPRGYALDDVGPSRSVRGDK